MLWRSEGDPQRSTAGVVLSLAFMVMVAAVFALVVFGNLGYHVTMFLDTPKGAQLTSMTGRDRIWVVAMEEWQNNRLFGYGPGMWDTDFRAAIKMPYATHAHNQFVDTLARSGLVGATSLVLYAVCLLVLSFARARETRGLSLALFLSLSLMSISEVPLLMLGYSNDLVFHLLLVATLAANPRMQSRTAVAPAARPNGRPVTS
jgi:O-antigen ligase